MNLDKSLYEILLQTTNIYPKNYAICFENKLITYQKLLKEVDKLAEFLHEMNVKEKDIVTVSMPNMPMSIISLYAINKLGAICYEIHPKTPCNLMREYMKKVNSKILLVINIFAEKYISLIDELDIKIITFNPFYQNNALMRLVCNIKSPKEKVIRYEKVKEKDTKLSLVKWNIEDTAILLNTGGTTGSSKIVEISTKAINALASTGVSILGIKDPQNSYMLGVLPLFHGFGLCMGVHSPIMYGACISLMMKFNVSKTIKLIKHDRLTIIIGVPTLYKLLLKNKKFYNKKLQNLTASYVGGDAVPEKLIHDYNEALEKYGSSSRLYEGYGLTETVTVCAVNTKEQNCHLSVGKAVPGAVIKIVDPQTHEFLVNGKLGEIVVSGDILMNGYFKDNDATNKIMLIKDGVKYLLTGDYGYLNDDNYLFFKQRLKRIVKVSGNIICPSDVENVVSKLNGIHEVYATSMPHEIRGQMIKLFVVKDKNINITEEELNKNIKQAIMDNISIYALPKKIVYLDSFPKTEIGKIDGKRIEKENPDA
ncbi:MAG: acyl--CoA ligase [Mollicutes bacterium]|nr:acyl--CoA ligase [Mollicutes bacterium]